ncbi:hypothetical protein PISMIDRAFT_462500 [Pisolithus microcarpus 441]|uniref:Uncharacterized protein n=1 Tax=Pisolithus microcarpus 441 TaxID=765257 RepID=A0A0C9Y557_9AGAM|nr:hypothetical protein BKA83DRAFT_462500 [Pisolithus microcarpus]KIK12141.1 hypothetical protein PISMIDRAFT_462500 [Pisolithus microcarpus 441]
MSGRSRWQRRWQPDRKRKPITLPCEARGGMINGKSKERGRDRVSRESPLRKARASRRGVLAIVIGAVTIVLPGWILSTMCSLAPCRRDVPSTQQMHPIRPTLGRVSIVRHSQRHSDLRRGLEQLLQTHGSSIRIARASLRHSSSSCSLRKSRVSRPFLTF